MSQIKVMVNGLPGNMSGKAAEHILRDSSLKLIPHALTGPEIEATEDLEGTLRVLVAGRRVERPGPPRAGQAGPLEHRCRIGPHDEEQRGQGGQSDRPAHRSDIGAPGAARVEPHPLSP